MARHQFAVIALAAIALASSFGILLDLVTAYSRSSENLGVVPFERRFEVLSKNMPPHSVLGYVSDNPANDAAAQAEYYLTQYSLVPAIVKASTDEHFVVANFHSNAPNKAMLQAKHLELVQDFGNDVFIYRNTTR